MDVEGVTMSHRLEGQGMQALTLLQPHCCPTKQVERHTPHLLTAHPSIISPLSTSSHISPPHSASFNNFPSLYINLITHSLSTQSSHDAF